MNIKCKACGRGWDAIETDVKCPFCGSALPVKKKAPEYFTDFDPALEYLVSEFGAEIYLDPKRALGILSDIAPGLEKGRRRLKLCGEAGILTRFIEVDPADRSAQEIAAAKAVSLLVDSYDLQSERAEEIVWGVARSLGWQRGAPRPAVQTEQRLSPRGPAVRADAEKGEAYRRETERLHTVLFNLAVKAARDSAPKPAVQTEPRQSAPKRVVVPAAKKDEGSGSGTDRQQAAFVESAAKIENDQAVKPARRFLNCSAGDVIKFGSYPQAGDGAPADIEWRVLEVKDGKALLLSESLLDAMPYHTEDTFVTWERCALREWLNGPFADNAFSPEERALIVVSALPADHNPNYATAPGNATWDEVFLLSHPEAKAYLKGKKTGMCMPTAYAKKRGVYLSAWWWLRTPGSSSSKAACVGFGAVFHNVGFTVDDGKIAVRPALRIDLQTPLF